MSDESPPPQLRLRPRKPDDESSPAASPETVTPPSSLPVEPPRTAEVFAEPVARFRLKPKLKLDAEDNVETWVGGVTPPPASPPPEVATAAAETAADTPKLKLKSVAATTSSSSSAVIPPPLPTATVVPPPLFIPAAPPVLPAMPVLPSPPLMVGGLPPVVVKPPTARSPLAGTSKAAVFAPPPPLAKPASKGGSKRIGLLLVVLAIILGGAAFYFLKLDGGTPEAVATSQSAPARPTGNAAPTSEGATPGGPRIAPLPPPPSVPPSSVQSKQPIQTGPTSAAVSLAFKTWVDNARITGVVVGESPRAIINGRLVRAGEMVDASQGIVFDGVDTQRKEIVFRNGTGLFAGKAY